VSALADVTIRPAQRADLLAVVRIEQACFSQPWPFTAFEQFLGESGFLVADRDGEILGYLVSDLVSNAGRPIGHVKDLAVREDARGNGLGRALLERGLFALSFEGAALVKLEVRETNEAALSLYRSVGFEPLRRISRYYEDGEDALVMVVDTAEWHTSRSRSGHSRRRPDDGRE
jgi:ribosomal-protein-alanine N-acetyltransferase